MNATDTKSYQEGKRQSLSWKLKAIHRLHRRCDGLTRTNTYMPIHSYSRVPPIHMLHQCYVERLSCIYSTFRAYVWRMLLMCFATE